MKRGDTDTGGARLGDERLEALVDEALREAANPPAVDLNPMDRVTVPTLGDSRKNSYQNAQDFRSPSRRATRRIASYVTGGATPKAGEKTSRLV